MESEPTSAILSLCQRKVGCKYLSHFVKKKYKFAFNNKNVIDL